MIIIKIKKSLSRDGRWRLPTDDLITLTDINPVEFYRILYNIKDKLPFFDIIDEFTHETVGNLITVLEKLYGTRVEDAFVKAGLFIPHSYRIELMEFFLSIVNEELISHIIRYDEFKAMLDYTGDFNQALDIYYTEFIPLRKMIEESCTCFIMKKNLKSPAEKTVIAYLDSLFKRHILDIRGLFFHIEEQLHHATYQRETTEEDSNKEKKEKMSRIIEAKKTLSLDSEHVTKAIIKKQYKKLMKIFHPDINSQGLEMCKKINNAYMFLTTVIS